MTEQFFGRQIKYTISVLRAHREPLDAGGDDNEAITKLKLAEQYSRVIMQIVVSLLVVGMSFLLLFKSVDESLQKIAAGLIGTVLGYWLH